MCIRDREDSDYEEVKDKKKKYCKDLVNTVTQFSGTEIPGVGLPRYLKYLRSTENFQNRVMTESRKFSVYFNLMLYINVINWDYIRHVEICELEMWVLSESEEYVLMGIMGPVKKNDRWEIRNNPKIAECVRGIFKQLCSK